MLAAGGIVTSPTLAMIGEAGPEAVIPLSKMGGMGGGVTVNVNGGISTSQEISQAIVKALQNYVYQSGPVPINTRAM
jgi:succinyl-CoA synthetase beta subunit